MEPRAHHDVRFIQPIDQLVEIRRIMLTIRVDLDYRLVPLPLGEQESGPHGTTHTDVEGQGRNIGPSLASKTCRGVRRPVIHNEHTALGVVILDLRDHFRDGALLIPRWNGDKHITWIHEPYGRPPQRRFRLA